jgi:hypothetical protein
MVQIRYRKVTLVKNERFSQPLVIAPWEVPVLVEAHSKSLIKDTGEVIVNRKDLPAASAEFERLVNRYKHGENSEVPYVARVYGVSGLAVKVIEKLIRDSVVGNEAGEEATGESEGILEISDEAFVTGEGTPEDGVVEVAA